MSATDTATEEAEAEKAPVPGPKRLQPYQIAIVIGVLIAAVTAGSGLIYEFVTGWHDESPESRAVFAGIPGWMRLVFYTVIPVVLVYGSFMFAQRMKNWPRGGPDRRDLTPRNAKKRMESLRAGLYMQTLLRDPAAGVMHSLIYFSFLVLLAVTIVLEINHQVPEGLKFLHGDVYRAYAFVADLAGVVFVVGVVWAIVRRYVQKPYRIRIKTKPEHALILGVLLLIGVSGFVAEGARIELEGQPSFEKAAFVGYALSYLFDEFSNSALDTIQNLMWSIHVLSFVAFLLILPVTMLRHIFTSPLNMYLSDRDRPKGAMKAMPNLMETEMESFGASVVQDFTWKQLLDTDACTMCGRCTAVCPAHATGKPLDPREIVLKTGEVMDATGASEGVAAAERGSGDRDQRGLGVRADHARRGVELHHLQGLRRELPGQHRDPRQDPRHAPLPLADGVQLPHRVRQRLPGHGELRQPLGHVAVRARPTGPRTSRASRSSTAATRSPPSSCCWVGCAGSFDDKNKKVTQAMAKLLQRAEVSFAILGPAGDVHRRPRPPLRQRVHLPDAGHAEHRDTRRHGRAQDHHAVPPLLQHPRQRVPPDGW